MEKDENELREFMYEMARPAVEWECLNKTQFVKRQCSDSDCSDDCEEVGRYYTDQCNDEVQGVIECVEHEGKYFARHRECEFEDMFDVYEVPKCENPMEKVLDLKRALDYMMMDEEEREEKEREKEDEYEREDK